MGSFLSQHPCSTRATMSHFAYITCDSCNLCRLIECTQDLFMNIQNVKLYNQILIFQALEHKTSKLIFSIGPRCDKAKSYTSKYVHVYIPGTINRLIGRKDLRLIGKVLLSDCHCNFFFNS